MQAPPFRMMGPPGGELSWLLLVKSGPTCTVNRHCHLLVGHCQLQDPVARKPISANQGLNVVQGFWFSCLKALPLLVLRDNLKAALLKLLSENRLLESTLLWIKVESKIAANPGLA